MLCCLCLDDLEKETAVSLSEHNAYFASLIKVIENYIQLQLIEDEAVLHYICPDCNERLIEIESYFTYIKKKQQALKVDYLEVNLPPIFENYIKHEDQLIEAEYLDYSAEEEIIEYKEPTHDVDYQKTNGSNQTNSNDSNSLQCKFCNKTFRLKKWLENHINRVHKQKINRSCHICNKSFYKPDTLRRHIKCVHNNIYAHICDKCGKKFKNKDCLTKHINAHQGIVEPPEQCDICEKWLKNKHSLNLHRVKHSKSYEKCNICERVCNNKIALKQHIDYVHKLERKHKCKFCEKSFKLPKQLEEHVATHTGKQLYSCPYCTKNWRAKTNMYTHIKREHAIEWQKSKIARSNKNNTQSSYR